MPARDERSADALSDEVEEHDTDEGERCADALSDTVDEPDVDELENAPPSDGPPASEGTGENNSRPVVEAQRHSGAATGAPSTPQTVAAPEVSVAAPDAGIDAGVEARAVEVAATDSRPAAPGPEGQRGNGPVLGSPKTSPAAVSPVPTGRPTEANATSAADPDLATADSPSAGIEDRSAVPTTEPGLAQSNHGGESRAGAKGKSAKQRPLGAAQDSSGSPPILQSSGGPTAPASPLTGSPLTETTLAPANATDATANSASTSTHGASATSTPSSGGAPGEATAVPPGTPGPADAASPVPAGDLTRAQTRQFLQRVVHAFEAARQRGGGPLRLRLSPPELGSLRLEIQMRSHGMVASIETDSASTQTLLTEHLPAIRQRLENQGVRVEQFDIFHGEARQPGQDQEQAPNTTSRRPEESARGTERGETGESVESAEEPGVYRNGRLNVVV